MTIAVRECKVNEIFSAISFSQISDEYAAECAIEGFPYPKPDISMYETLERYCGKMFVVLGAFTEDRVLVGFIVMMIAVNPHYGLPFGSSESFFVLPAFRKTGAGLLLLNEAKRVAKDRGAVACKFSAMVGSKLDSVLQASDSKHTNNIYTVPL